ncbi:hypothetical protein [Umezawaea sp. Da 62-37]|uniref:hypothetical protein n=1 Tax=Umezawaea sp. Da 62-37 TaxID=3075927 RepID=UPI0028F72B08|nr:hypothetical protein [Umezawaea sp. Da 62-37]WNV83693.1 hypothetical protein RM788_36755 [Umezawaea sp. Da 62-37]
MSTEAKRLGRIGRVISACTWAIASVVMIYGALTVTPWLVERGIPSGSAWMLTPLVDAALVLSLVGDRVLAQHGRSTRWGTTLRAVTGITTLLLNIAPSALKGDRVGIALHAVGPVLLWVATEAAGAYQRQFTSLANDLANPPGDLATSPIHQVHQVPSHQATDLATPAARQVHRVPVHQVADLVRQNDQVAVHQVDQVPAASPVTVEHQAAATLGDNAAEQAEPVHQAEPASPVRQPDDGLVNVPRQAGDALARTPRRRATAKPRQVATVDLADLVTRARQVLADARIAGRQVGRASLARELGITEHRARQVLGEATKPHLAAVHAEG